MSRFRVRASMHLRPGVDPLELEDGAVVILRRGVQSEAFFRAVDTVLIASEGESNIACLLRNGQSIDRDRIVISLAVEVRNEPSEKK